MQDFWDTWSPIIVIVVFLVLVFGSLFFLQYQFELHQCLAKTAEIGFQHKFDFWGGCRILVENRWIPLDNWYFKTQ